MESLIVVLVCIIFIYLIKYLFGIKIDDVKKIKELGYDVIPKGYYLVLGDNRNNSMDGRNFGLIKKEDIIGKAWIRLWPLNKLKIVK